MNLNRREFGKSILSGAVGLGLAGAASAAGSSSGPAAPSSPSAASSSGAASASSPIATLSPGDFASPAAPARKKASMYVAEDHFDFFTDEDFQYMLRHGVKHFEANVRKASEEGEWDLDEMKRMRDLADKNGCTIIMSPLKTLKVGKKEGKGWRPNNILMGKSPERDREIEIIQNNIRKAAAVGIPAVRYHWRMAQAYRNGNVKGEGGNVFLSWTLEDNWKELPVGLAGKVPLDLFWERIDYFLKGIMPVAEEYKVRVACHPSDPPLPPGYRGVDTWNYNTFEGMKRYAEIANNPWFGFLMCVGTVGEGMTDPAGNEVSDIVRYFGERKKIFMIHLRNIKGKRDHFTEWYPDSGDMDLYKVVKVLRDVEYPHAILPDHMPSIPDHPDDPKCKQAFAFGFGYIQGLIQAVNA